LTNLDRQDNVEHLVNLTYNQAENLTYLTNLTNLIKLTNLTNMVNLTNLTKQTSLNNLHHFIIRINLSGQTIKQEQIKMTTRFWLS